MPFTNHTKHFKMHINQEQLVQDQNLKYIVGLDECGWGSGAGPLGVGCCILSSFSDLKVKDSKMYSNERLREAAYLKVKEDMMWGKVECIPAETLNAKGLARCKDKAIISLIEEALKFLNTNPREIVVVVDGSYLPKTLPEEFKKYRIIAVPKADEKITACSAASILGKVEHDRIMHFLAQDPSLAPYELDKNMGYLTATHIKALKEHGVSPIHRINVKLIKEILKSQCQKTLET